MKKLILVFILLLSVSVPVFSEEPQSEDLEGPVLAVDDTTTEEEDINKENDDDEVVEEVIVNELIINKKDYQLEAYSSRQINYKTEGGEEVNFKSLNPKVVTVDTGGFMSATAAGKTEIEIVFVPDEGETITEKISVEVLKEDGAVTFKKSEFYLIRDLYFDVEYSLEGSIQAGELIWESTKPDVAVVENGRVKGLGLGSTVITASTGDVSASMTVYVTAPLEGLAYNPEKLEMVLGEEKGLPSLVYAPYDTTTAKNPKITIKDPDLVDLSNDVLTAQKVGETIVTAQINDITAELAVVVRPEINKNGANLITLITESKQKEQITFKTPDLTLYDEQVFSINFPLEESLEFIEENNEADIFIILDDELYANDMKKIDELILAEEIMTKLEGKNIRIHLLNQNNVPMIIYEFNHGVNSKLDLKYSVRELKENDPLFSLVQTKAYHASFANEDGFPEKTVAKIPAQATGSHYKQLHFIYQVEDKSLSDPNQEVTIDSKDYLNIDLKGNSYLITLSKVSIVNDSKVIVTLSIVLFVSLISGVLFYYYKAHYKNKKV